MIKKVLLIIVISLPSLVCAQLARDVFPFTREFYNGGFYISPLATISFGNKIDGTFTSADTTYNYENTGRGKWGYGIEIGWYQTFEKSRFIDYVEGGLGFRRFAGAAEHKGDLAINTVPVSAFESDNEFAINTVTAVVRVVDVKQLKANRFFTYGLGANFNYTIADDLERETDYPNSFEENQNGTFLQAHFQIGYGFKVSETLLIIPTLETPLVTAYPTDDLNPAFTFFSAKYQPLIIGLKFMIMRKDPVNCNAPSLMGSPPSN